MTVEPSELAGAPAASAIASNPESHPAPSRTQVSQRALWFGLGGGPAAWSVQTIANLATASHDCYPHLFPLALPAAGSMRTALLALAALAVVICIAALTVAAGSWRRTRDEHQTRTGVASGGGFSSALLETGEGRTRFLASAGLMTSVTFLFLCGAQSVALIVVAPCGR